jgi:hypothetical protein
MNLFAVIRTRGGAWQSGASLEGQEQWGEHARFMNALKAEGLVVLGGPLEGTPDVLLIMRAASTGEILARLELDPWTGMDLLRVRTITPWTLRLGSLP